MVGLPRYRAVGKPAASHAVTRLTADARRDGRFLELSCRPAEKVLGSGFTEMRSDAHISAEHHGDESVNRDIVPSGTSSSIPSLRKQLLSPKELAHSLGLKPATLADWRSQGKGPGYFKAGRMIWYPLDRVGAWIESQMREGSTSDGTANQRRDVALPLQVRRQAVRKNNRLGRHKTK